MKASRLMGLALIQALLCSLPSPPPAVATPEAKQPGAQASPYPARVIIFPEKSSLGEVYLVVPTPSSHYWSKESSRRPFAAARGRVSIPAGSTVRLSVMYEGGMDTTPLRNLRGDDIQSLDLTRVEFHRDTGKNLSRMTGLKELTASDTDAGDEFARDLLPLQGLQCITLNRTTLSDKGLQYLAQLKNLKILSLSYNDIGDEGIARLGNLKGLESLHLHKARLTDAGLKALEGLKNLHHLTLTDTRITDAGLASIARMDALTYLTIDGTRVRGPGLKDLATLKHLKTIIYSDNTVASYCVAALQKKLPRCNIITPQSQTQKKREREPLTP
ncbi:MAG: hypothetical protein JSS86_13370 [Cyanobacteria bacterium SZAS LIN-2]|nr:hypothetical protein [Cyanobacteria bacterium SZAS LIN-2]